LGSCICRRLQVPVDRAQHCQEGCRHDIAMDAYSIAAERITQTQLYITRCSGISPSANGVLMVIHEPDRQAEGLYEGVDGTFAFALDRAALTVVLELGLNMKALTIIVL